MALAHVAVCQDDTPRTARLAEEALRLFSTTGALKREQDVKRFLLALHDSSSRAMLDLVSN